MSVTMDDIKKLRDITQAGMMDCKKALGDANGNIEEALKILKEKGLADAKKRSDRETKEGGVFIKKKDNRIAVIQLGCETDFVSKNEVFVSLKDRILEKMIESGKDDVNNYQDLVQEGIAKIKENIEFKKAKILDLTNNQTAQIYIHGNNKIGVVTVFECKDKKVENSEKFKEYANNICLHITANSPFYLTNSDVPQKEIDEQKNIFKKQMEGTNKPANIIENILKGKIAKFLSEICLVNQNYVKDDKISVEKYTKSIADELKTEIKIVNFVRFMIGK